MNTCPACSQPIAPNDLACPKCGITLHHGTATAGPASVGGKGLTIAAIVIFAGIGITLLVGFLGVYFFARLEVVAAPAAVPIPAGVPIRIDSEAEPDVDLNNPPIYFPTQEKPSERP